MSIIHCPNCGTKIENNVERYIAGDTYNIKKIYVICQNCGLKSIIRSYIVR